MVEILILGLTPSHVFLACRGSTESSLGGWVRECLPWGRWEIVFQNIAAFSLLFGIWRGSIFYAVSTQILRMCYKIIANFPSLTSLGLQERLSLVQWLPVNFRIDYSISFSVLWRSKVSCGCLMIPLVQNCRSLSLLHGFFFFFSFFKRFIFFSP